MKHLLSILLILFPLLTKAQTFNGTWEGVYITSDSSFWEKIKLVFEWQPDSGYLVKSYTAGKNKIGEDTIIVCRLNYKLADTNFLLLSEVEIVAPLGIKPGICLQTMELKYYPGRAHEAASLAGKWYCNPNRSIGDGYIRLKKISR